jgi:glutaconate CoA-transferase subunit B
MAAALSRQFGEKEHGFIGLGTGDRAFILAVGIPTVAAQLAVERGADFSLQYGTLFDPDVQGMPDTLGDPDLLRWECAARVPVERCLDVFRRGLMTCSFISGAQIDMYGNLNSVRIGRGERPDVRLTGPIAQADHAVFAQRTFVIVPHERRVFVERVDFVSSVGTRVRLVVTDLGVLEPRDGELTLTGIQPGLKIEDVLAATGWPLRVADDVRELEPPGERELATLRELRAR